MQLDAIPLPELKLRIAHCDMLDKLITVADGDAALLYLYLLRNGNPGNGYAVDDILAMRNLRMSKDRYRRAVFTLSNLVLSVANPATVSTAGSPAAAAVPPKRNSNIPNYTIDELGCARREDPIFAGVCQSVESIWNRTLDERSLRCLYTVYDYWGLSAEAIIELLAYLKREKGGIRLADIQREANAWANLGIISGPDAQRYLAQKGNRQPLINALCKGLGVDPEQASRKIQNTAARLLAQGFPPEAIELAMRRGERQQGEKKLNYVEGILKRWHQANVHTISEITAFEPESRAAAAGLVRLANAANVTGLAGPTLSANATSPTSSASQAGPMEPRYFVDVPATKGTFPFEPTPSWRASIWDDGTDKDERDSPETVGKGRGGSPLSDTDDDDAEEEALWRQAWLKQFRQDMLSDTPKEGDGNDVQ